MTFSLLACAVCYGDKNSAMTHGFNYGILTLLVVTGMVLGGMLAFVITLARRARRVAIEQQPAATAS